MKRSWIAVWGAVLALLPMLAQGADSGTVFVETTLRASPSPTARALATLEAETAVTVEQSRGLWLRVTPANGGESGWVRRFDVRTGAARKRQSGGSPFGGLANLFSGGERRQGQVTATIGVRGLDAADLQGARPDPGAVRALDAFRASVTDAETAARRAGVSARDVPYPEVAARSEPIRGGGRPGASPFDY